MPSGIERRRCNFAGSHSYYRSQAEKGKEGEFERGKPVTVFPAQADTPLFSTANLFFTAANRRTATHVWDLPLLDQSATTERCDNLGAARCRPPAKNCKKISLPLAFDFITMYISRNDVITD